MQAFRNKTKWKLQATKTWVTTFFAGTTLQKAKQQTNIWELLYDWLQGISREQVCAGVRGKSVPLLKREYPEASPLNPPPYFPKLAFPHLNFLVETVFQGCYEHVSPLGQKYSTSHWREGNASLKQLLKFRKTVGYFNTITYYSELQIVLQIIT